MPMAGAATASKAGSIAAFAACAAVLSGCDIDSQPYYRIVAGMEPVEEGSFERDSLYFDDAIPIRYRVQADGYVLVADVERDTLHPSLVFSVIGGTVPNPVISGESPSNCFGRFLSPGWLYPDLRDAQHVVHLYTSDLSARECRDDSYVQDGLATVVVSVASGSGEVAGVHELSIRLERTGMRILWDGP